MEQQHARIRKESAATSIFKDLRVYINGHVVLSIVIALAPIVYIGLHPDLLAQTFAYHFTSFFWKNIFYFHVPRLFLLFCHSIVIFTITCKGRQHNLKEMLLNGQATIHHQPVDKTTHIIATELVSA